MTCHTAQILYSVLYLQASWNRLNAMVQHHSVNGHPSFTKFTYIPAWCCRKGSLPHRQQSKHAFPPHGSRAVFKMVSRRASLAKRRAVDFKNQRAGCLTAARIESRVSRAEKKCWTRTSLQGGVSGRAITRKKRAVALSWTCELPSPPPSKPCRWGRDREVDIYWNPFMSRREASELTYMLYPHLYIFSSPRRLLIPN